MSSIGWKRAIYRDLTTSAVISCEGIERKYLDTQGELISVPPTPWHLIQRKSKSPASAGNLLSCKRATQNVVALLGWFGLAALAFSWKALFNLAEYVTRRGG